MSGGLATKRAIHDYLAADAALLALVHGNSVESIYERSAPQEAVFPFVVYFKSASSPDYDFGSHVDEEIWTIKGVDKGDSSFRAQQIADELEEVLHDAPLAIAGHYTLYCRREEDLDMAEVEKGATIHHAGALYRLYKQPI